MPNTWPEKPRLLGTRIQRLDGPEKATGRAKYSYDVNRPNMLHAAMLRCPYPHAKLVSLDTAAAEKMPGVKAVYICTNVKPGYEFIFAGEEIAAVAAETEEQARDAARAIQAKYEQLDFFVKEEDALKTPGAKTVKGPGNSNLIVTREELKGDNLDAAFKSADAVVEGEYGASTICHQCLEAHGLVAEWEKEDKLKVWFSTQTTTGMVNQLVTRFKPTIPSISVECVTHYMGGGFGSKFNVDEWGFAAAELARKAGRPVKLMLDRASEIMVAGTRPSTYAKVKIGGKKDGTLVAFEADCWGSPGFLNNFNVALPYVYTDVIANSRVKKTVVRLNAAMQRAMRAPGHPQSCLITDTAVDDLAAKLGIDPLKVRLKNLPPTVEESVKNAPQSWNALRNKIYVKQLEIAAKEVDWEKRWHPPGQDKGPVKHGMGMAMHTWGGAGNKDNDVTITIDNHGTVSLDCSTQDLGTGERGVLAIVTAETLGLEVKDIAIHVGESRYGRSTGSGGSTTCPGTAPAALNAACAARDALFEKIAGKLGAKQGDLVIEPGNVKDKASGKAWSWREACARLGADSVKGTGNWTPGLSNQQVGGVQVAEVLVDTETGVVRCTKMVAVQDCGLIVNLQGVESQVAGGVVMGVNYALFEERIMDRNTGRQVNADMEFYKLGGLVDMPHIVVRMVDMPQRGVIGIGEPPTISTAAAVGNAIFNAIGVRVPFTPYSPENVLAALSRKGGKE